MMGKEKEHTISRISANIGLIDHNSCNFGLVHNLDGSIAYKMKKYRHKW